MTSLLSRRRWTLMMHVDWRFFHVQHNEHESSTQSVWNKPRKVLKRGKTETKSWSSGNILTGFILQKAGVGDLQDTVATRLRRFIGHVLRLPTSRPASLVLDWTPEGGSRRRGRPKRTWRDTFAEDMREMGVSGSGTHDEARSVASDRARWRQQSSPSVPDAPKSK